MNLFWDMRFREAGFAYGETPNGFFKETLDGLLPGALLLPGEGEGRNALYAAKAGWTVTALDQSEAGRYKALSLAARHETVFDYVTADLTQAELPQARFDAAALIFIHLPPDVRAAFHRRVAQSLKPGGVLMAELFARGQLERDSGGPRDASLLVTPEMLKQDFSDLDLQTCAEQDVMLSEGRYHKGLARVVRVIARRPPFRNQD
jgi:SAM-dependent methyltransferase